MRNLVVTFLICSALQAAMAQKPAESPKFPVKEYLVKGNTVLPTLLVEQALAPYLGPGKQFRDIDAARAALEKAYQDAGFLSVVVNLPNQNITAGVVQLEVVEAKVERLKVEGAEFNRPSAIRDKVPSLAAGAIPYFPQVQQELAAVQSSDLAVTPLIGAGTQPDTLAVDLKVEDKLALHGSVELNNRQSFNTSRGRLESALSFSNLWQRGHTLGLSWQYAPWRPKDGNTITGLYVLPLGAADDLSLSYTNSRTDTPTGTRLGGATLTRGTFYGLRWLRTLNANQWPIRHTLTTGVDYKINRDIDQGVAGITQERTPLKYPALSLAYAVNWLRDSGPGTAINMSASASSSALASRKFNCNGVTLDQFACKRKGAEPDFFVGKASITDNGAAWGNWRWLVRADVQLANGPLVSGEQMSLGGTDTVRGYYDYEQTGDIGWFARAELYTPYWQADSKAWRMNALAFADAGLLKTRQAQAGQRSLSRLSSVGVGLRLEGLAAWRFAADLAIPQKDSFRPADSGADQVATQKGEPRLEVSARVAF